MEIAAVVEAVEEAVVEAVEDADKEMVEVGRARREIRQGAGVQMLPRVENKSLLLFAPIVYEALSNFYDGIGCCGRVERWYQGVNK